MSEHVPADTFLYLTRKDVMATCAHLDSVEIIREVFRLHATNQTILPDEAYLGWRNNQGEQVRSINMPAYVGGTLQSAGTKIINGNIANPTRGLPRASGLTLLYDDTTVRVTCMMESAYVSSLRTASVSILSALLLQDTPIEHVAVIGAGVIAQMHIELLMKYLPALRTIRIFDINPQQIDQLRRALTALPQQVTLQATATAEEAVRSAQLIIPATTTTSPYIPYNWLQAGAIVVNVSLDDVMPDVVWQANAIIVDDWMLVKNDTRRLLGRMYHEGSLVGPDDPAPAHSQAIRRVDAQLGDLVDGRRVGRQSAQDIILVNPFGLAIEDVALATYVYRTARELGLGQHLSY